MKKEELKFDMSEATKKSIEAGKSLGEKINKQATSGLDNKDLDSGRAWLVLAAMFLINSTAGGSSRAYGLIYAKQVASGYYDHQAASWPIATASSVENLAAILTPALCRVLSWRQIQLLSTSLFVVSNLGAYFSRSLAVDILCLGLVQGLALSMCTVLTLAMNNDYFRRLRTTAFGVTMCGSTCGILYLSPLVGASLKASGTSDRHVEADHFRSAYLALAAVFALNYPLALLVEPRARGAEVEREEKRNEKMVVSCAQANGSVKGNGHRSINRKKSPLDLESHFAGRKLSVASISDECRVRRQSTLSRGPSHEPRGCCPAVSSVEQPPEVANRQPEDKGAAGEQVAPTRVRAARAATSKIEEEPGGGLTLMRLFACPYLHFVWIMLALYFLVARIFIIVLVDFAADHSIEESDSLSLLNYWSAGEVCGRILLCSFVDLQWLSVRNCVILTCGSLSLSIALMIQFAGHYCVYAACSLLVAALISLEYVLINVLIIEYLGASQVTSCYSLGSLLASPILFLRPALIGLFRDQLGSYDGLLILLAACCLLFALLFALLEPVARRLWPQSKGS